MSAKVWREIMEVQMNQKNSPFPPPSPTHTPKERGNQKKCSR